MSEEQGPYLAAAVAGTDDETAHETAHEAATQAIQALKDALAEERAETAVRIAELEVENRQLTLERDAWRSRYEAFRENVKRHNDGITAAIIKSEVHN